MCIRDSGTGTATAADGTFLISVPDNAVLVFSSVGYASQQIAVGNRSSLTIVMKTAQQSLDAVVVVGYGTQKKRDLTGSITSVKGEDIAKIPATNPISSLQGKVPGLSLIHI